MPAYQVALEAFEDYDQGSVIIEMIIDEKCDDSLKNDLVLRKISTFEENTIRRNQEIESGNRFIVDELTRFIGNLKTAIKNDISSAKSKQEQRTKEGDRGSDWDDDDWDDEPSDDTPDYSDDDENPTVDYDEDDRSD
jgi:hypothetical protein